MQDFCKSIITITSFVGVYQLIYLLWTFAEKRELGEAIVTKADTVVCIILSMIITLFLVVGSFISD